MISREELQEVKRKTRDTAYVVTYNMYLDDGYHDRVDDNERLLDLLEAAERYAREDALKEYLPLDGNGTEVKEGDKVRLLSDWSYWASLEAGQVVTVHHIQQGGWIVVEDEAGKSHFVKARSVEHIKPDSWEKLEEDARKQSWDYWDCPSTSCEDCCSLIEGKTPDEFYGCIGCFEAQKLDIIARAKRLAEGGGQNGNRA